MSSIWVTAAVILSFFVSALTGKWLVPFLHKINFGQTIRESGPKWHSKKNGTPIMGGFMFIISILLTVAVCVPLWFGFFGFIDDYIKAVKKRNLGLSVRQKLLLQFLAAGSYLFALWRSGSGSRMLVPFAGSVDWGVWYWIVSLLGIVGMVNAVNFTDGIDGLNGSVTLFASLAFLLIAGMMQLTPVGIFAGAVAGGCLGFLLWNFNPAKVFMGDTGSLFLGGVVCALGYALNVPVLLLLVGAVYILEILSVILQVCYFKATHGKRLFKMSPIHHHFELCGWSEKKICTVFSAVTVACGIGAALLAHFGI